MTAMLVEGKAQARFCEAIGGNAGVGELKPSGHTLLGTPPELGERYFVSGELTANSGLLIQEQPSPQAGPRFAGVVTARSSKKLSDAI
jgi:hypothetical protein